MPSATETLQDIISLIAYPTPSSSPLKHYLSQERRETVASSLNDFIVAKSGGNRWTSLERLVQQATIVREKLNLEKDAKNKVFLF
jgi:glucose-induced degradation protein 8